MAAYTYEYPRPAVSVDVVAWSYRDEQLRVLLIRRGRPPFRGMWAFPGGFMDMNETPEQAAMRELFEETGLTVGQVHQIGAFGTVDRDPRTRVISIAYNVILHGHTPMDVAGGDDAAQARWFSVAELPELAFDHGAIFLAARRHLEYQIRYGDAAGTLLGHSCTADQKARLLHLACGGEQPA